MKHEERENISLIAELRASGYTQSQAFNEALSRTENWVYAVALYKAAERMYLRVFEGSPTT